MGKYKVIIGVIAAMVAVATGGVFYVINNGSEDDSGSKSANSGTGVLEIIENDFDFGEILMAGGTVKHNFTVRNVGDGPVRIKNAKTSCMCTTAIFFDVNGEKVGPFGMHGASSGIDMEIQPGEEIVVEATYDPMAHGPDATGKLVREIFLGTDTGKKISIKFRGEGVKQFSEAEGPSLAFNNKEYDFGVIKQSQGVVKTQFNVVNNGTETVIIESLPASCACTEATIDKKEIAVGEKAVITVAFDANLHPEPEGRFFKTIELVSNIKPAFELKIYARLDYDLGIDKLKLQEHNEADNHTEEADGHDGTGFKSISSADLDTMLKDKDFTLIDVHTPEQQHIPGTDYMISYDEIDKIVSAIPSKNSKIVLYCRSGGMSRQTAEKLTARGYTKVYNLANGIKEWTAQGRETLPKGSLQELK